MAPFLQSATNEVILRVKPSRHPEATAAMVHGGSATAQACCRPWYHLCNACLTGVQNVSYRGFHTDLKAWKCKAVSGYPQAVPERGMHDIVRVKYSCMEDSRIF
jgi:hypothetical protein